MRKINFFTGNYYHICNKAHSNSKIFIDLKDYLHFLLCLKEFNTPLHIEFRILHLMKKARQRETLPQAPLTGAPNPELVKIVSYCLLSDRFHLVLKQSREDGIPAFMQKLGTGFAMYANTRYKTSGHIFRGKYLANPLHTPDEVLFTSTFIHLLPLKRKKEQIFSAKLTPLLFEKIKNYPWSSISDYLNFSPPALTAPELRSVRPPIEKEYALYALSLMMGKTYEDYCMQFSKEKNKYIRPAKVHFLLS